MNEAIFVRQNKEKWLTYEKKISVAKKLPADVVSDIYQDLISDLAYSQSQFPQARVTIYLNNLSNSLHDVIYINHKKDYSKIIKLFTYEIPKIVADAHFEMKLSFGMFMIFVIAGVILAIQDIQNVISTLGYDYVDMTLKNIKNGHPTNVYGYSSSEEMFFFIIFNNIEVDFITYAYGIIPFFGPMYILYKNGIVLGEFQTLFFLNDVGFQSMTAIWIHGALEISSLIVCAASALRLGLGWLFSKTYSRKEAFKRSGIQSIKILCTVLPLTFFAAILESYVTRHVEFPLNVKLLIIFGSFAFIIFYYIYLPHQIRKNEKF